MSATSAVRYAVVAAAMLCAAVFATPDSATISPAYPANINVTHGSNFTFKLTVTSSATEGTGQAIGIFCTLYYGAVQYWGGSWSMMPQLNGTYVGDTSDLSGDVYVVNTSKIPVAKYEVAGFCADSSGRAWVSTDGQNVKMTVLLSASCGDGTLEYWDGEVCDGGTNCTNCTCNTGNVPNKHSPGSCTRCGNGVLDSGEVCDTALGSNCTWPCVCNTGFTYNASLSSCTARCGDNLYAPLAGEACDNTSDTHCVKCKCTSGYSSDSNGGCYALCGDGVKESTEQCDSKLSSSCLSNCSCPSNMVYRTDLADCSTCGNGVADSGEECDYQSSSSASTSTCSSDCQCKTSYVSTSPVSTECSLCGNGAWDTTDNEVCEYLLGKHCQKDCTCPSGYSPTTEVSGCTSNDSGTSSGVIIGAVVGGVGGALLITLMGVGFAMFSIKRIRMRAPPPNFPVEMPENSMTQTSHFMPLSTGGQGTSGSDGGLQHNMSTYNNISSPSPQVAFPSAYEPTMLGAPPPAQTGAAVLFDAAGNPVSVMVVNGTAVLSSGSHSQGQIQGGGGYNSGGAHDGLTLQDTVPPPPTYTGQMNSVVGPPAIATFASGSVFSTAANAPPSS